MTTQSDIDAGPHAGLGTVPEDYAPGAWPFPTGQRRSAGPYTQAQLDAIFADRKKADDTEGGTCD